MKEWEGPKLAARLARSECPELKTKSTAAGTDIAGRVGDEVISIAGEAQNDAFCSGKKNRDNN
jgi:hypothetical protein